MIISVIIPVYNSIEYLRRCVDSVLGQSFTDYEVLLIDDGSTDGSSYVCDEYAGRYDHVTVIHQQHGGVSSACNRGIDNAVGEYLMFCDSDDYVEPDWMETLFRYIEQNPDLFVFSAFYKDDCDRSQPFRLKDASPDKRFSSDEYYYMYTNGFFAYRWNCVYLRNTVVNNQIRFQENVSLGEDILFNIEYLKQCLGYMYIDKPLYHWVNNRNESLSRVFHANYYDIVKTLYYPRLNAVADKDKQAFCYGYLSCFYSCIDIVNDTRCTLSPKEKKAYIRYMLHDGVFNHALKHSGSSHLKTLLRFKSYSVVRIYKKYKRIKRKRTEKHRMDIV